MSSLPGDFGRFCDDVRKLREERERNYDDGVKRPADDAEVDDGAARAMGLTIEVEHRSDGTVSTRKPGGEWERRLRDPNIGDDGKYKEPDA